MSKSVYTVSSLNQYVKRILDNDMFLKTIMVKGEVSNFTNHRSGHWYFTLKDAKAKINCVMFSTYASRNKVMLKEGMKVIVSCSLSMYEAQGNCQLIVTKVQADGIGDLYVQLQQLKEKLSAEGLFLEEHKKELPLYPLSIGVITAKTGAAVQDILSVIARRWPIADVQVYPTLVQGAKASEHIIESLKIAEQSHHEVILLARGGGAIEDLWCFNDEALARMIYGMNTILVSGVGHETDTTLVDYVSDARAPTPTAAAELITPDIIQVKQYISDVYNQLCLDMEFIIQSSRRNLKQLSDTRYLKDPMSYIMNDRMKLAMHMKELEAIQMHHKDKSMRLQQLSSRMASSASGLTSKYANTRNQLENTLRHAIQMKLHESKQQITVKSALLDAFSPLKVLARGYSITYQDDAIVHSVKALNTQDELHIRMEDGMIETQIKQIKEF